MVSADMLKVGDQLRLRDKIVTVHEAVYAQLPPAGVALLHRLAVQPGRGVIHGSFQQVSQGNRPVKDVFFREVVKVHPEGFFIDSYFSGQQFFQA